MKMVKWDWILIVIFLVSSTPMQCEESCLIGDINDVQSWVMNDGSLNPSIININYTIDLSGRPDELAELRLLLNSYENDKSYSNVRDEFGRGNKFSEMPSDTHHTNQIANENDPQVTLNNILFLSLARNSLKRVPLFYTNSQGITGSHWKTLKYLTLYGNNFNDDSITPTSTSTQYSVTLNATYSEEINPRHYFSYSDGKSNWAEDLSKLNFSKLLELDLRNCSIRVLSDDTFLLMPNLRRLYLSDNAIYQINIFAFNGLFNLVHLDISRNIVKISSKSETGYIDGITILKKAFKPLTSLKSLDFSHTKIIQTCAAVFSELKSTVERLSLCYTTFPYISQQMFKNTSMKYLDVSGNGALDQLDNSAFVGIEDTLEILYANHLPIKNMKPFENLTKLKVLALADNNIDSISRENFANLKDLQILDLSRNRITNWDGSVLGDLKNLKLLRLEKNNLNLLSLEMLKDFKTLNFLSVGKNTYVCNCLVRGFIERARYNEMHFSENLDTYPEWITNETESKSEYLLDVNDEKFYVNLSENIDFHNAYIHYSNMIHAINPNFDGDPGQESDECYNTRKLKVSNSTSDHTEMCFAQNFTFRLLDYKEDRYQCTDSRTNQLLDFFDTDTCPKNETDINHRPDIKKSTSFMIILLVVAVIVMITFLVVWKWWSLRYFFVMLKNIAILSTVGKDKSGGDSEKLFVYDVFVSYCDEDRSWILDELLPEIECHPAISACLHERDFQVGMTILENIISCMDRSRVLLMIVSQQFLLSRWCQFEMHLAQHRLLETRREELILVLLEDIPRRKRPNTLHYLMMTKTYIVWPKNKADKPLFWKRLKRAILHNKTSHKTSIA